MRELRKYDYNHIMIVESWPGCWLNATETFFIALKFKKPGIIFANQALFKIPATSNTLSLLMVSN